MSKTKIFNSIRRFGYDVAFKAKQHSPEILMVAGVVGTAASFVMACKATTKVSAIMEENRKTVECIHTCMEDASLSEEYTEEDGKKDLTITYSQTAWKLVKLYAPSVTLATLSVASMVTSNRILRKRNVALAAAYATVDKCFKTYRERVVERFGEEVDRQLKYNIKQKEVTETIVDENGEEKTITKTVDVVSPTELYSEYARIFDELNDNWEKNPEYNLLFLRSRQNYFNDLLRTRGRVFLNDVYKELGFEPTQAGQVVGWVYDPQNPKCDGFIDFGIYRSNSLSSSRFVNGYEDAIILDFNVDGNIMKKLPRI